MGQKYQIKRGTNWRIKIAVLSDTHIRQLTDGAVDYLKKPFKK